MKAKIFACSLFKKGFNISNVLIIHMIFNSFSFKFLNNSWLIGWGVFTYVQVAIGSMIHSHIFKQRLVHWARSACCKNHEKRR